MTWLVPAGEPLETMGPEWELREYLNIHTPKTSIFSSFVQENFVGATGLDCGNLPFRAGSLVRRLDDTFLGIACVSGRRYSSLLLMRQQPVHLCVPNVLKLLHLTGLSLHDIAIVCDTLGN